MLVLAYSWHGPGVLLVGFSMLLAPARRACIRFIAQPAGRVKDLHVISIAQHVGAPVQLLGEACPVKKGQHLATARCIVLRRQLSNIISLIAGELRPRHHLLVAAVA